MSKRERSKGIRFERKLVNIFREAGFAAKRVPLSGSAEGFKGDIIVEDMTGEVKVRRNDFNRLYRWLYERDFLAIKADRKPFLIVLTLDKFIELLRRSYNGSKDPADADNA